MSIKNKVDTILKKLSKGLFEKEEALRFSLLSALAGESIFLLGPPGVAKSLIARKLKFAFSGGSSFEYLMNKFSTPDEIFGPVSIKKLKDEDKYERLTDKYLPGASIVFLDEIWKAGPSIQNALLTVLNEKIYRNGEQEIRVNIKGIIAASNELPAYGEGLEALWDRFLLRYIITEIRSSGNFVEMISDTSDLYADTLSDEEKISEAELALWTSEIDAVELPPEVINTIQLIKYRTEQYDASTDGTPFRVYDRRWKKIVRLLRTSAYLNERRKVDLMDCFLIAHCLWNLPEQLEIAQQIVAETVRKHGYTLSLNLNTLKSEIRDLEEEVKSETRIPNVIAVEELKPIEREYYEVLNMEQYFEATRIKRNDYDRLNLDEESTLNLFDAGNNLTNRVKALRGKEPNSISIYYNSKTYIFYLRTMKSEKTEVIYRKAHPLIESYWNERIDTLRNYINEQKTHVSEKAPEDLYALKNNLFINSELSEIVEANMRDVTDTLKQLELRLDKIKFSFETLGQQ
jgi:MoxR-like ATPase